jgi:hypothetical protein
MRLTVSGVIAAALLAPLPAGRTVACEGYRVSIRVATVDLSAEAQKKARKKVALKKTQKVEYMRAAPLPPGVK